MVVHWACWKLHILSIWHKVDKQVTLIASLYFAFSFTPSIHDCVEVGPDSWANPLHSRYSPREQVMPPVHSHILTPRVTLVIPLLDFRNEDISLLSQSVYLFLFFPHSPSSTSWFLFIPDRKWEEDWMRWQLRAEIRCNFLSLIRSWKQLLSVLLSPALSRM